MSRGDWPEETLDGAVVLDCLVCVLSAPTRLCEPSDAGANESTGDMDGVAVKDDCGTAYNGSWGNDVCRNEEWAGGSCWKGYEGGG